MRIDALIEFFLSPKTSEELSRVAIAITREPDLAQDILHDVCCALYIKAEELGEIDEPLPYLKKCVRNVAKNWVLKESRSMAVDPTTFYELECERSEEEIKKMEIRNWVKSNLPEYSEDRRDAFIQHYLDGYPLEALAAHYGVSANALSQQFSRMRTKLKNKDPRIFTMLMSMSRII